jgi:prophage antirepressor-like protein
MDSSDTEKNTPEAPSVALFRGNRIRRLLHNGEWWFSVVDVIEALTGSVNPRDYWFRMKDRVKEDDGFQLSTICRQLKLEAPDGKMRETDCADVEGMLRVIQSIPSSKAEPFKRWLARVGFERLKEIENPELATKRTRVLYKANGYSEDWIEKRMRGIVIREELTEEWKLRGADGRQDFEILTAEISKATFGVTPSEYKKLKGLERENLRDHMDDFELIFNMLGERATTEIHRNEDSKGVEKLKSDAKVGGGIAGGARKALEKRLGRPVVSRKNFLKGGEDRKKLK